jgi:acetyl-CoA acetyltransferase
MPREAAIVGAGHTPFGDRPETSATLFSQVLQEALDDVDAGLPRDRIDEAYVGSLAFGGDQLGNHAALHTELAGLDGVPVRRVENACASSGYALRDAVHAVRSGAADVALAGGVETMNDLTPHHQRYWLGVSGDTAWERLAGVTFPGVYALMAKRHMHEHGTTRKQLARVAVKNHANGARNPNAQFQKEVTADRVLSAPTVADPLGLFDCCGTTDGAACVLVAGEEVAEDLADPPIWVEGTGAGSDELAVHDRPSLTRLEATREAARQAYGEAGVEAGDLDLAEVHDCFTIAEVLAVEDLGLAPEGEGGEWIAEGRGDRDGEVAVNPSGGLKAKGHPLGATGAGQAAEAYKQLRGEAGDRQVPEARTALTHNVGGSGATCAVHVLGRR